MILDDIALLALLVLVGLFVVYEMVGVDPRFKHVHSISYLAKHHRWLALAIGLAFVVALVLTELWWRHHLAGPIFK